MKIQLFQHGIIMAAMLLALPLSTLGKVDCDERCYQLHYPTGSNGAVKLCAHVDLTHCNNAAGYKGNGTQNFYACKLKDNGKKCTYDKPCKNDPTSRSDLNGKC